MGSVQVTIDDETLEIERDAWDVLMLAVNVLVDTGDIAAHARISNGLLARAKMASGALYHIANRLASTPTDIIDPPQEDPLNGPAAKAARARRLQRLARHPSSPAPACVVRALLPVLGVSESAMRPTLVPIPFSSRGSQSE